MGHGHRDRNDRARGVAQVLDHLDELRARLVVSVAVLAVAFGFCLWQNHTLLRIVNRPLEDQTRNSCAPGQRHGRRDGTGAAGRVLDRGAAVTQTAGGAGPARQWLRLRHAPSCGALRPLAAQG